MTIDGKITVEEIGKTLGKQTEKEVNALKSLNLFDKTNESKKFERMFPQNQMNDLIRDRVNH